jgi:hypothetical protein
MYAKKNTRKSVKKIKDVIKKTFQCIFHSSGSGGGGGGVYHSVCGTASLLS